MNSDKRSLGQELRFARESLNLSLREIERTTGVSNAYLSQLENDKIQKPSPHFLNKLANVYGISFELIMEKAGYIQKKERSGAPKTLAGAALFAQENLTPDEEEELLRYLQYYRKRKGLE